MSFLYRTQPALRTLARPSSRLFTSTAIQNKSATEAVKDTAKTVDRKVSDAAVSGIEKGRKNIPFLRHYHPLYKHFTFLPAASQQSSHSSPTIHTPPT
jgi:hypothetical protein